MLSEAELGSLRTLQGLTGRFMLRTRIGRGASRRAGGSPLGLLHCASSLASRCSSSCSHACSLHQASRPALACSVMQYLSHEEPTNMVGMMFMHLHFVHQSLPHTLILVVPCSSIQSISRSVNPSINHPFIHSFIHSSIHSFIHPFIHSFMHALIHSFIHPAMHSFLCLSFTHSFTPVSIRTCTHSIFLSYTVWSFACSVTTQNAVGASWDSQTRTPSSLLVTGWLLLYREHTSPLCSADL